MMRPQRGVGGAGPPPPPHPPAGAEEPSFFKQAPTILLQLSSKHKLMARGYYSMYSNVFVAVADKSGSENRGVARYLNRVNAVLAGPTAAADPRHQKFEYLPQTQVCDLEYVFKVPMLPKSGLLVVLMRPPSSWGSSREHPDLKFVYRLSDLYLEGFWSDSLLWLFKDATLEGALTEEEEEQWVKRLPFKGSYCSGGLEPNFQELKLGGDGFFSTYKTLSRCGVRTTRQIQVAATRMTVSVSEAVRFPFLERMIHGSCATGLPIVVDPSPQKAFSDNFYNWVTDGDKIKVDEEGEDVKLLLHVGMVKLGPDRNLQRVDQAP